MQQSDLVSLHTLARRLSVTKSWLAQEAKAGRIPALSAGARFLFSASAVEKVLAQRAAESIPSADEDLDYA